MKRIVFLFSILMCLMVFQDVQASGSSPPGLKLEVSSYDYCPVLSVVDAPQAVLAAELAPTLYYITTYQGTVIQGAGDMKLDSKYFISNLNTTAGAEIDEMTQLKTLINVMTREALMGTRLSYTKLGYSLWN